MTPFLTAVAVAVVVGATLGIVGSIVIALVGLGGGHPAFLIPFTVGAASVAATAFLGRPAAR